MNSAHADYGWLFRELAEETDGGIVIDPEHPSQELKLAAVQILWNQIERDTAQKKLAEVIQ